MSGDPHFFFNWSLSLSIVYVLEKNEKIYGAEVWLFSIFLSTRHRIILIFVCVRSQMSSLRATSNYKDDTSWTYLRNIYA